MWSRENLSRVAVPALFACLLLSACTPDGEAPSPAPVPAASLRVAVYGSPALVAAYRAIATDYTAKHAQVHVAIEAYGSAAEARAAVATQSAAHQAPDLFLADPEGLDSVVEGGMNQPMGDLLAEHQLDFGDQFDRTALETFSRKSALQCMPLDRSPLVVFYNRQLVDPSTLPTAVASPTDAKQGWTLDDFAAVAQAASNQAHRGIAIDATLDEVAPFLFAGGGAVVDDVRTPSAVKIGDPAGSTAFANLLALIHQPGVAWMPADLAKQNAVARFQTGQVAMILGYRDLVPTLRSTPNLKFDVLPMPHGVKAGTTGREDGICLSADSTHVAAAIDFVRTLVEPAAMATLAHTGAVVPTNLAVASSPDFLQPDQQPASSHVFVDEIQRIKDLPSTPAWLPIQSAINGLLGQFFALPVAAGQADVANQFAGLIVQLQPQLAQLTATPSPSPSASTQAAKN